MKSHVNFIFRDTTKYHPRSIKEKTVKFSKLAKVAVVATVSVALAIPSYTTATAASKFDTAKSAAEAGGMAALRSQCKKEGQINIIATPDDWANYGAIKKAFVAKYGIKMDSADEEGSSQDEINAADRLKGTNRSPDVFDIGTSVAVKYTTTHFAPYKVQVWQSIPASNKNADGYTTNNYTGTMSIWYSGDLPTINSLDDLLKPEFKGKVALNGDPQGSNAALSGLFMVSIAKGGSFDNIQPAVDFFKKLKAAGNFINVNPTAATIASGQTPVVIDWTYNQVGAAEKFKAVGKVWKSFIPKNAIVGSFYNAAISAWAPHPACARLWMEFIYTPYAQNVWAAAGASPVLWPVLLKRNQASEDGKAAVGTGRAFAASATAAQQLKARDVLKTAWPAAVGTN